MDLGSGLDVWTQLQGAKAFPNHLFQGYYGRFHLTGNSFPKDKEELGRGR